MKAIAFRPPSSVWPSARAAAGKPLRRARPVQPILIGAAAGRAGENPRFPWRERG